MRQAVAIEDHRVGERCVRECGFRVRPPGRGARHVRLAVVRTRASTSAAYASRKPSTIAATAAGPVDVERLRAACDPALRDRLAEIADVIGMEVW